MSVVLTYSCSNILLAFCNAQILSERLTGFFRLVMPKSYKNFWLAAGPEIKYINWGLYCMLQMISYFMAQHTTATQ